MSKILFFYFILFSLSIIPLVLKPKDDGSNKHKNEQFKIELRSLNSVKKISYYTDSVYYGCYPNAKLDTLLFVNVSSEIIKNRFHHGLAAYSYLDNWIAFISAKLIWNHIGAVVDPEDILKYSTGLCSQQTIVFLEILKRKGIDVRCVGLGYAEGPGHFLAEVYYQGSWHAYDIDKEPRWERIANHHQSISYYQQHQDSLFLVYEGIISRPVFNKIMTKVKYGAVNEFPAKNMLLFHRITKIITYLIPIFFGIIILISLFKQRVPSKIIKETFSKING